MFAVSSLGTLAVVHGAITGANLNTLSWATRQGRVSSAEPATGAPPSGRRQQVRFSPDGSMAAVVIATPLRRELWLADWTRETWTACGDCNAFRAEWSPDGRRLLLGRANTLVEHALDGSSPDRVLVTEAGLNVSLSPGPGSPTVASSIRRRRRPIRINLKSKYWSPGFN